MGSEFVSRLVVLVALFLLTQGEDGPSSDHIQTQQDRNDVMKVFKEDLVKRAEECNKKHSSNTKLTWLMLQSHTDYRPGKCFLHCMLRTYEMVNTIGELRGDVIRSSAERIPSEKTRRLVVDSVDGCVGQATGVRDGCEQAYKLSKCLYKNAFEVGTDNRLD